MDRYTNLPADLRRPSNFSQGQTTTTYDALGRPLLSTAPNGQQTAYTYAGRATAQWAIGRLGETINRVLKRNDLDGLGNLQFIRTYKWNGQRYDQEGLITQTHDVVGNLTRVEQANGLGVTTLTYDLAGHKTGMNDVDMGLWRYTYDRQGKLVTQTDACGNTTTLRYEADLQRVRSKTFTPGGGCQPIAATANVTYTYDSAASARGQLTGVAYSDGSYAKTLTYNALGLLASTTLTVSGTSYTTQVGYDAYQRPSVTTQPSGEQVSVAYNSLGLTKQLDSLLPGATSAQNLVNGVTYDEVGRLTSIAFPAGGNLVRSQIYARFNQPDNDGGQLQSLQVQGPTSTLLKLGYHYDSYGNIKQSTDSPIGATSVQTATFTYDDQNRLLTAYNKTNAYDPAGRLTKYEDLPTTHNTSFPVHAVKQVNLPSTGSHTLSIRAMGTDALGGWPQLELWVNGVNVTSWTVTGAWQTYTANVTLNGQDHVDLVFPNDAFTATTDRNLVIESLQVDNQPPLPPTAAVYDGGAGAAAFDGQDVIPGQSTLFWSGALRFVLNGTAQYAYNANGNLVNRAGQTLTWDAENHLQSVTGPGVDEQYRYDESGQRLQKIVGDQVTTYVNSQYEAQQAICTGQTPAGNTNWQTYAGTGLYLDVDTRHCGFADTPLYFTTLEGTANHDLTTGAQAIYSASATGFRVYLRFTDGRTFTPADANGWGWRLTWHATPKSLVSSQLCTGQTPAGNTNWQTYGTNGVYVDVDTRACGYTGTPLYQTSLIGANHWTVTGITALYTATPTGFRIYLRYIGGNALTPSMANGWGWQLAWNATPAAVQTPTLCSGQTPGGSTNWQANGSNSLYLDVNTTACGFTTTPRYLTALSGSNHWTILGVNAIYTPTPTGFRVYVRTSDGSALSPAAANGWGWSLTWRAVNRQYALVTQSYSFNGQRIAQRKDGVLTYLHADHLGSTLLATDAQGNVVGGNQPRYFAYGRERTPSLAALPTDYTYTGQKQDGSGLVYMNARYYDPQIGQFISPDTEVPDATNLFAYNRFMYVNGNPLRYNDPSGHGGPLAGALPQTNVWQTVIDTLNLAAAGGATAAAASEVGPPAAAAAGLAVVIGGTYIAAQRAMQDNGPTVPPLYPTLGQNVGDGNISITIPVPNSTTVTSGVPLTPGAQTQSTGVTAINQPTQQLIEPLPAQQMGNNVLRLVYQPSSKHNPNARGNISLAPTNGQIALDNSVQVGPNSPRRVGVDRSTGEIAVLDQTSTGVFHGHVRTWNQLTQRMQNALINAGLVNQRGKIR